MALSLPPTLNPQRLMAWLAVALVLAAVVWWLAPVLTPFVVAAVLAYCGWQFVNAPDVREMLLWGGGAALACAGMVLIKIWFWLELQKNSVVREIKRLELQVARLTSNTAR